MAPMKDAALIKWLSELEGIKTQAALAKALSVEPRTVWNWKDRNKISAEMRPRVWAFANDRGANLPREWLTGRAA